MSGTNERSTMSEKQLQIFEAARMCYEFGLSQREVAQSLGLSPATLTRLLKKARDIGIIRISVVPPEGYVRDTHLVSDKLKHLLGVEEVIITPSSSRPEIVRRELGYAAAEWLMRQTAFGMWIGFSGGRSVGAMVPFLKRGDLAIHVVQLMGGLSSREHQVEADVIARASANQLNEVCHVIHGPAIFPDERSLDQFVGNSIVAMTIESFNRLNLAVVGVGTIDSDNPLMRVGFLSESEVARLASQGCVGDICGHFFNEEGQECDPALARRILGIRLEQLARTPKVCAVAAGERKVNAIIGACRAGIPKTLVTDMVTAEMILATLEKMG